MHLREYNAAEVGPNRLRFSYDVREGHPTKVQFDVNAEQADTAQQTSRSFTADPSIPGSQPTNRTYAGSGMDRFHLAQREAFAGDPAAERAADSHATTVPGSPNLNRGAGSPWRAAERRTVDLARQYGKVRVEIDLIYDANPPRMQDGTPIPKAFTRTVRTADGSVLESASYPNQ
jgi:DNA/RNA endonuclease G (NUC1)